ncbi:MAG: glycosyltransferase family 39 protein [Myxococcales bacterium]|nr:glycosyltransferase family 39 protein [Myxococcales bacterium]
MLFSLVGVLTLLRLWAASRVGLGDVEAYYWTWSRELSAGYLDHGPLVAWLIKLGTTVLGDTAFAVRVPFVLVSALTLLALAGVAERAVADGPDDATHVRGDLRASLAAVAALMCMPMFIVAGGAANPDVPLALLEVLFIGALLNAARAADDRRDAWRPFAVAGLLAGLACLAKFFAVLLVIPLAATALARPRGRRLAPLLASLAAMAVAASPELYWNVQHDFASLRYHFIERHSSGFGPSLTNLGKLVGGQLLYASPGVLLLMGATFVWAWRRRAQAPLLTGPLLRVALPLGVAALLLIALMPGAEPHWTVPAYLPLCVVAGVALPRWWRLRRWRVVTALSVGFSLLVAAAFHVHVLTDFGVRLMPESYVPRYDLSNELHGWRRIGRDLAPLVRTLRVSSKTRRLVLVSGAHYTTCAQLSFAAQGRYRVACPSPRLDQFDMRDGGDGSALRGVDLVYVRDERFPWDAEQLYRCERTRDLRRVRIHRGGRLVRRFVMQLCEGFAGLRIKRWPPEVKPRLSTSKGSASGR